MKLSIRGHGIESKKLDLTGRGFELRDDRFYVSEELSWSPDEVPPGKYFESVYYKDDDTILCSGPLREPIDVHGGGNVYIARRTLWLRMYDLQPASE